MISSRRSSFSLEKIKSIGQFDIILWWILITVVQSTRCSEYKIPSASNVYEWKKMQKVGAWTRHSMNKSNFYQRVMLWLPQKLGLFWICPASYFIKNYRKIMNFETLFTWLQKLWSNEICNELVSEFLELLNTPPYLKSSMLALCTLDQQQCNVLLPGLVFRSWFFKIEMPWGNYWLTRYFVTLFECPLCNIAWNGTTQ